MKCPSLLVLLLAGVVSADNYRPTVGHLHRAFILPNIETGEPVSLADYAGKKVLLLHFASW